MSARSHHWLLAPSLAALIAGVFLSQMVEPGVRVEHVILGARTPAIRLSPAAPGKHPIVLLSHGATGSKENFFRFGEALAAAGFDCYTIDQAGHGESPIPCSLDNLFVTPQELAPGIGPVEIFIGHSMGGAVGARAARDAGFRPRLFIAVGSDSEVGKDGPPVLRLIGRYDFFLWFIDQPVTSEVISPWSDHIIEPWDPLLVNAAVKGACDTFGKPVTPAPTAWKWRLAGLALGLAGALGLMFRLPELHPRLANARGLIVPAVLIIAGILTLGTWVGVTPQLRRIPQQLVLLPVIWLALAGLGRLRLPRWSLAVISLGLGLGFLAAFFLSDFFLSAMLMGIFVISAPLLLAGAAVGRIATRSESRRDGDLAMAIFAGYAIGQFMPLFY